MCVDPIVIEPEGFSVGLAWESCREDQENVVGKDGEVNWGAAFGADPGCVSCPACRETHWAWGKTQRCTRCGFEYPTSWWSSVGKGSGDRGTLEHAIVAPTRPDCPYYMYGWRNRGLTCSGRDDVDWRGVVESFEPWSPTPEESASIASAIHGDCKHYRGTQENRCGAGVNLRSLVGGEDHGWCTRLPCLESFRNRPNGPTARCDRFALPTAAEVAADEAEHDAALARFMAALPLVKRIKAENKKKSATGEESCPACGKRLRWSHAGYNGHVHLMCETEGCVSFTE